MAQQVNNPTLSPQWLGLLLWHGFNAWPENFNIGGKKKEKKIGGGGGCVWYMQTLAILYKGLEYPLLFLTMGGVLEPVPCGQEQGRRYTYIYIYIYMLLFIQVKSIKY